MKRLLVICLVLMLSAVSAFAQDSTVTADQVNAIAKGLFCPVCENIPLDTCETAACQDWRDEIRIQLENGMTEEQIVDDFVRRFGERVVGVPRNPILTVLGIIAPWAVVLAVLVALMRAFTQNIRPKSEATDTVASEGDYFRDLLEQDLAGKK